MALAGVGPEDNPRRRKLNAAALLAGRVGCWLEIGFGSGEHLLAHSRARPDILMLGAETYTAGVAALLADLAGVVPANLRIHHGDGRDLLDVLPEGVVTRGFVLFPDPWPKRRHAARRIISPETLDALAAAMAPGGELRVASDAPVMVRHALRALTSHGGFEWTARRPGDWRRPWEDWTGTRYEAKALREGRTPAYLTFVRA